MKVCGILLTVMTAAPYVSIFDVTNCLAPLVSVTTVMTEETPMMTPIKVRMVRILFAHSDCNASLKASPNGMIYFHDTQSPDSGFRRKKSATGAAKSLCRAQ